jgi:N-acetyl-anhydromuramyl-L-alanine amidase AmpD
MGKTARIPTPTAVLAAAAAATIALTGALPATAAPLPDRTAPTVSTTPIASAFETAARRYDVPRDLLVSVGYAESHLDGHDGLPSQDNGYGVMHLVSNPRNKTLTEASRLTGLPADQLRRDTAANILGAAAVLDSYAAQAGLTGQARKDPAAWYGVVARYSHSADASVGRLYTDEVYRILGSGVRAEGVRTAPKQVQPHRGRYAAVAPSGTSTPQAVAATDYPGASWNAACTCNYQTANRTSMTSIVVHVTQGSYAGTISWFKNPAADVSAHYVVRSSDGQITQMVREKDIAWHARSANPTSVGIEHEGFVSQPSWFTDAMYRSSAALVRNIADRRGIPKDRAHIVGHSEVPGNDHTDPGPNWNWTYYMQLVAGGNPPTYNFSTYGTSVNVRADARLNAAVVTTLRGPTQVFVVCQKRGDTVTAEGVTHNWWSKLRDQGGFMTNIYIDHPASQLPGVPICA